MSGAVAAERTERERLVCSSEELLINTYKAAIQRPNAVVDWKRFGSELESDKFKTADGRTIQGVVWKAKSPRGFVIVAQGTSMLAAEIYEQFRDFTSIGLDVYIYDFRGYGMSEGNTSLNALIEDYAQRTRELSSRAEYEHKFLYGLSLGGVILSNAAKRLEMNYSGLILDSAPHAIPWYAFCPSKLDPVENFPNSCSNWLVVAGSPKLDRVLGSRPLTLQTSATDECGAAKYGPDALGHIFMDSEPNTALA
jgi:hypothetical protein